MEKLTDQTVLQLIKSPISTQQDRALNYLYESYFGMVESMILENSGNKEQVKDVFQDGIIVLFNMIRSENFVLTSQIKTLLYSICRKKWLMVIRKDKRQTPLANQHDFIPVEDDHFEKIVLTERKTMIVELFDKLGEECKKTLQLFYYEKQKMAKIAEILGLASEAVAKNKKSNCMKQMRKLVLNNPLYVKTLRP